MKFWVKFKIFDEIWNCGWNLKLWTKFEILYWKLINWFLISNNLSWLKVLTHKFPTPFLIDKNILILVREMRSFPTSFYQQQPTSPQRASSGFGSISGSPCNPYSTFPTYGGPSAFPAHHTAASPLATTNNGDQSLWTSPYAAAYAQQFQQNHAAYAGSAAGNPSNSHLYNTPLHTLSATSGTGSSYSPQSSIFQSQSQSTLSLPSTHQDQLSNQSSFATGKI